MGADPNASETNISRFLQNVILSIISSDRRETCVPEIQLSNSVGPRFPSWKRILDVSFILVTLPFWLPLMIAIMAWIRVTSSGPVFYRQQRVGYRGQVFMIFKFRTMHRNVETQTHEFHFERLMKSDTPMQKLDACGDSRLIWGGRLIRAAGLDELPQIFNVLRGEMTMVGPRPCLPCEFHHYQAGQKQRVNAPPGLTGYWQVNGKNNVTFSEMVAMDLFYLENMSLRLDLTIMLRTIPVLLIEMLEAGRRVRQRLHNSQSLEVTGAESAEMKKI